MGGAATRRNSSPPPPVPRMEASPRQRAAPAAARTGRRGQEWRKGLRGLMSSPPPPLARLQPPSGSRPASRKP